jgi:hypothetical protein
MSRNSDALFALVPIVALSIISIALGALLLKRKGYSPHWAWFGAIPIAGLLVIVVAIFVPWRLGSSGGSRSRVADGGLTPEAAYHKRMRETGFGLFALGGIQALLAAATMIAGSPPLSLLIGSLVGSLAAVFITLGIFAYRRHSWVNWVVLLIALTAAVANLAVVGAASQEGSATSFLPCFALIIPALLLHGSVRNIQSHRRAKAFRRLSSAPQVEMP